MDEVNQILDSILENMPNYKRSSTSEESEQISAEIIDELQNRVLKYDLQKTSTNPFKPNITQDELFLKKTEYETKYKAAEYYCCPRPQKYKQSPPEGSQNEKSYSSILEKPFIFRRAESLDKAVTLEEKRLIYLYKHQQSAEEKRSLTNISESSTTSTTSTSSTNTSFTGISVPDPKFQTHIKDYIKKLSVLEEEDGELEKSIISHNKLESSERKVEYVERESAAMTTAQQYLRLHRIFEFYQFLIAHLLSALPENPIHFLLDLLEKCLIYRSGLSAPPLLYERKHVEVLFDMMDRMRTGYIDLQQYRAGMKTIGLCTIEQDFFINSQSDTRINKQTFVEEALTNQESVLNDILRRKRMKDLMSPTNPPPPTPLTQNRTSNASSGNITLACTTQVSKSELESLV